MTQPARAPRADRPEHPARLPFEVPAGWRVRRRHGPRPFVTSAVLERPDGSEVTWTSRRHRKRLGLRPPGGRRARRPLRHASRTSVAMGLLFTVGSACFAAGSLPAYADRVSAGTEVWTFFVGSVFFTSAAYLQYQEAVGAPAGPGDDATVPRGLRRFAAVSPHRIDWWASSVQLVGTVFFNVTTFAATRDSLEVTQARRWVWAPDVAGSICFLVASWLACAESAADNDGRGLRGRSTGWWISALNLLGSVAFGVAAVAARYLRSTGEIANMSLANLGTFVGAVCFFVGAALLPVESARDAAPGA